MGEYRADLLPSFYFRWNGISMKPILMSEVMPKLTSRHERNALKTHVLLLNSPGQQKAKRGEGGGGLAGRIVFTPNVYTHIYTPPLTVYDSSS